MVWPPLTGEDWGRLVEDDSRLLRYLGDWEEFEHRKTQCRFWRDTILVEQETAVRKLQLLFRQYWFIKIPPPGEWRSRAYSWDMPEAVQDQERQRTGWALLRRRGKLLREVTDVDRRVWQEYMDPVCGEMFYYLAHSGFSQWTRPKIPHQSIERVLEPFHLEDAVVFRFPGRVKPEHAKVMRVGRTATQASACTTSVARSFKQILERDLVEGAGPLCQGAAAVSRRCPCHPGRARRRKTTHEDACGQVGPPQVVVAKPKSAEAMELDKEEKASDSVL